MARTHFPNTKKRIIQLLQKNGEMRYTDIKNKIGLTDAAISKNLASLYDEGSLEYEKKGREKLYKISDVISKTFERKMNVLTNNYLDYLVVELPESAENYKEQYAAIERKVSSFLIFTILTSIQTGKNWFSAFDTNNLLQTLLGTIGSELSSKDEFFEKWAGNMDTMDWDEYFENAKKMCNSGNVANKISKMYEALRETYPDEIKELENLSRY